jgi:hypothetical protein
MITITKSQLIDILKNEPVHRLSSGFWFSHDGYERYVPIAEAKECSRCAVGAVLAAVLDASTPVAQLVDTAVQYDQQEYFAAQDMIDFAMEVGEAEPMRALSAYFEGRARQLAKAEQHSMHSALSHQAKETLRADTITFAENHLPETIEIRPRA